MTKKHLLRLHSRDRDVSSKSKYDCSFSLNSYHLGHITSIYLKTATVVNTSYNINSRNNSLVVSGEGGVKKTIRFPQGQFTVNQFVAQWNALDDFKLYPITNQTQYRKFTWGGGTEVIYGSESSMGHLIGVETDVSKGTASYIIAPNVYDLSGINSLHIWSSNLAYGDGMISSNRKNYPIMGTIPLDVGFGCVKTIDEESISADHVLYVDGKNSLCGSISIKLLDDTMQVADLNGSEWEMVFTIYSNSD